MFIKDKDYKVDDIIQSIDFQKNLLKKVNDKLMLTNYQIEVLKRNGIDPSIYGSLSDIIYLAEEIYEDSLDEELDVIITELSERNYYENTKK